MKHFNVFLLVLLLAVGVLAGCGTTEDKSKETETNDPQNAAQEENSAFPVTITDALDNEVVVEAKPEKIVSLIPSNTEIAFALGLGDQVVGVSEYDNYPEEVTKKEKIGGMEFNVEKILSLTPNLILAHESTAETASVGLQQLKDAGITVLIVNDAKNFAQIYDSIEMIGSAAGEREEAEELIASMKTKLEEIKAKAAGIKEEDKKSVFVEVFPAPDISSPGKNTFMDEILSFINAKNIITEEGWPKIDPETVIKSNPDVIITTYGYYTEDPIEQVTGRDGWQNVKAVKNKQIVDVDSDRVTRSGPRIVEGVEDLAKAVYPDVFK